jgi:SAM-dependent methyltransferase
MDVGYCDELLAEHKRKTHLGLIERWAGNPAGSRILKTDLFEEAFGPDQFLFDLGRIDCNTMGIDISAEIVGQARKQAIRYGVDSSGYFCCDVRCIPLREGSIDLIISDSTLDHFSDEKEIITALRELRRILRPGGILILTLDNSRNLTYPPYFFVCLWMKLRLSPYFIGKTISLGKLIPALEEIGMTVEESTAIFHYPHPDCLVRGLERLLHKLSGGRLDGAIRKGLSLLDKLEGKRSRYLTGRYIAVKAVKRETR